MGSRKSATTSVSPKKKRGKAVKATAHLAHLQKVRDSSKKTFGKSASTRGIYDGYLKRGRQWLAQTVKMRRENPKQYANDGIDTGLLSQAFEGKPNRWSAKALEYLLVHNCFENGLKHQTGDGYHGAFNEYWGNMESHHGEYSLDEATGVVRGNPAQEHEVKTLVKTIQKRDKAGGAAATRDHAEALTIEELQSIISHSRKVCPDQIVEMAIAGKLDDTATKLAMEHAQMRAFLTTGFVIWTRNFELCQLKRSDIEWDCRSPLPPYSKYFTILLQNRKGWQNKSDYECSLESNTFNIYEQTRQGEPEVLHVFKTLPLWVRLLEARLGRPLWSDELIFPSISVNGQPQTLSMMSINIIGDKIDKFAQAAGLKRRFTTHSLRRGGAQYRFMWAPWGQRWSLRKVRWWGGWAEGENVETLMKYLLDSLSRYEENYRDALDPFRADRADYFMGDLHQAAPVTNEAFRAYTQNLGEVLSTAFQQSHHNNSVGSHPNQTHALWHPQLYQTPLPPSVSSRLPLAPIPSYQDSPSTLASSSSYPTSFPSSISSSHDPLSLAGTSSSTSISILPSSTSTFGIVEEPNSLLAIIPDLPRAKGSWKIAVQQWHEIDLRTGYALKNWPHHWYKGRMMTKNASKRNQRKLIALEYKRAGSDDGKFLEQYPQANGTIKALLDAIRVKRGTTRSSKNGSATARLAAASIDADFSDDDMV